MLNMIRADFYRCFHGKTFPLCLSFTFLWVIFCAFLQQATLTMRESLSGTTIQIDYWNSFWGYHPVIIPLLLFCCVDYMTDFKQKTIKLYVAKGISRWNFLFSKILMGWIVAFLFVVVALLAGIFSDVFFWGGNPSFFVNPNFLVFLLAYWLLHATAATFIISTIFLLRGNVICSAINLLFLIYGYFFFHKIELSLGYDNLITRFWLYSYIGSVDMSNLSSMLPKVLLLFVGYFVVFGAISNVMFRKIDVE